MKRFGLLGRKLSHSYSPQIHEFLGDYEYQLYEKEPDELDDFLTDCELDGMNVTIPYKKDVIKYCTKLSETAKKIGAVNTMVKCSDGGFYGYNTDYYGFLYMIKSINAEIDNKKAIVLGSGGASLTCQTVLKDLKVRELVVISRSGENNYQNISKHYDAEIIVNTTPVGMFPNVDESVLDLTPFSKCETVLDLIYNPRKTKLISQAENMGIKYSNGLSMLVAQAKQSAEFFLNEKIDDTLIEKIERKIQL